MNCLISLRNVWQIRSPFGTGVIDSALELDTTKKNLSVGRRVRSWATFYCVNIGKVEKLYVVTVYKLFKYVYIYIRQYIRYLHAHVRVRLVHSPVIMHTILRDPPVGVYPWLHLRMAGSPGSNTVWSPKTSEPSTGGGRLHTEHTSKCRVDSEFMDKIDQLHSNSEV